MPARLAALQHWMWGVISHPEGLAAGASTVRERSRGEPVPESFDEVVTPSSRLTARQRMGIYHRGYHLRLLNALSEMLPVLRHALGKEIFEGFAAEYLRRHPPRSYTLARLDDGFVAYLRATRPDRDRNDAGREDWPDFIIDLATLEHGIRVTYDGPGAEGEPPLDPAAIARRSDERLLRTVFRPVPCLRQEAFRFPVRDYLIAVRRGEDPPLPAPRDTQVALTRRDYCVRLLELTRPQHDLLSALALGDDVAASMRRAGLSELRILRPWLVSFTESGLFAAENDESSASRVVQSEVQSEARSEAKSEGESEGEHR